jgi:peptidoglycan/LPS O-acetylase OafA/YrhL
MNPKLNKNTLKIYPNLNALRFIAASLVFVFHVELYKKFYSLPNLMYLDFFKVIGKLGVVLFFVLSGFLITSLLLKEKDTSGTINFKSFYQRRILRIWPLYFLILGIGFFILPHFDYWKIPKEIFMPVADKFWLKLVLYLFILPNLAVALFKEIVGVSQVWSLGTEEQFYLMWPLIIRYFRNKLLPVMFYLLLFYWSVKIGSGKLASTSDLWIVINNFWSYFNINCMAIGGIAAVIFYDGHVKFLNVIFSKIFFGCALLVTILCLLAGINFGFFHYDVYAVLFAVIILNLACNPIYKNALENKLINYLGSISYGLYMFHPMILPIGILVGKFYNSSILIYLFSIFFTLLFSIVSFEYFEKYFLKIKSRLT